MSQSGNSKYYNIEPIAPLLEQGYQVLTPNSRLMRSIIASWNQRQLAAGVASWASPAVTPLEQWLQQQWRCAGRAGIFTPTVPVTKGQELELWQEVIAQYEQSDKGYSLLRPSAAAIQAKRARETLLRWQIDTDNPQTRQLFALDEDCATFYQWQTLFAQKLLSLGMTTSSDALVQLLSCAPALPSSKLALVGFDEVSPLLRACIDALANKVKWINSGTEAAVCKAHEFSDKRSELAGVARWAKELTDVNDSTSIGIIVPNMREDRPALEYLLRREFDALGANYTGLPVNFSAGLSLDQVPMVRDAFLVLGMHRQRIAVDDVVALLTSRYVALEDSSSASVMKFIRSLFDIGEAYINAGDLRYRGKGLDIGKHLLEMSGQRSLREKALPSVWADRFSAVLELWGWPGTNSLDSIEYQQLDVWFKMLEDYAAYDIISSPMGFDDALQLLNRCCAAQVSQPQTPQSNIQVLGLLEGAGLSFDHLWICDMRASVLPAPARPNPFIPVRLQREHAMPNATAEREWSFASGLMKQYVSCAVVVRASYACQQDGVPEKPSALLDAFQWEPSVPVATLDERWIQVQNSTQLQQLDDSQAPSIGEAELDVIRGGSGLIEDQSHCPFRAFAKRRMGISPLGDRGLGLSAASRGSLLHDALYHLWGVIGDSTGLEKMDNNELEQCVSVAVEAAIDGMPAYKKGSMGPVYYQLESRRLCTLLLEWLELERQRPPFMVLAREENISLQLGSLTLALRADRIDQLPDGAHFIIDYKSGLSSAQDWLGERPAKPQLPLYVAATAQTVAGLAFAQVRTRDCKYTGAGQIEVAAGIQSDIEKLVKDKMPAKDWEDLSAQWRENLERLAAEFMSGDAQVNPLKDSSCSYCGLQAFCRIGQ